MFDGDRRIATCLCPPLYLADPRTAVVAERRLFFWTKRPELIRLVARVGRALLWGQTTGSDAASGAPYILVPICGYLNVPSAGTRPN